MEIHSLYPDPEIEILSLNKESGFNYRQRRQEEWKETYLLYRDNVLINRLTQRQSVNLPLMKMFIRTLLKDIDDMPLIEFENLDNNKDAEIFYNEYWKYVLEKNKMGLKDIADKKQVLLFGRSFTQMQIVDGEVKFTIIDPNDILVDRYADPTDLDTARFLIHTNIFVPLSSLENNPNYNQEKVKELKVWFASEKGLLKSQENEKVRREKEEKMAEMGVPDVYNPVLGETIVELSLHFMYWREPQDKEEKLYLMVEAENSKVLMKKPLDKVIGKTKDDYWKNHYPYVSWTDDVEMQDFWSDGIGDMIRTPNKILNVWFSQLVENRTLRSFGMNYYNSSIEGFTPETFEPQAWGWYPIPGDPNQLIKRVEIPDLSESLDEMQFVINILEKSTGATATQQGAPIQKQITLGEVQLALSEAKERIKGWSKFYVPAWKERGEKFIKLLEAAEDKIKAVKIFKKGRNSQEIYQREISPKDWKSKEGYQVRVWTIEDKTNEENEAITKLSAVIQNIPDNPKLRDIFKRKLLEFAGLSPQEVSEVMEVEVQKTTTLQNQPNALENQSVLSSFSNNQPPVNQLPVNQK